MRMRNGGGRGQGGAARPVGRMHVVDRASAVLGLQTRWRAGVYQMQPGSKRSRTLTLFLYRVSSVLATFIYVFYAFVYTVYKSGSEVINYNN